MDGDAPGVRESVSIRLMQILFINVTLLKELHMQHITLKDTLCRILMDFIELLLFVENVDDSRVAQVKLSVHTDCRHLK